MTINGAITELVMLCEHPMMPNFFKPSIQKVIETIQMEFNEQNRRLDEIAHRLDLHERAMAKAMRDTTDISQTEMNKCYKCKWWNYSYGCSNKKGICDFERSE